MAVAAEEIKLTEGLKKFIGEWKDKPGNLIMVLHKVQEEYGYIPRPVAIQLSKEMDVPLAKIYGVVTFYHFFKVRKPGKHKIAVCIGTACYLKGGQDLLSELETILDTGVNSTTEDGVFSIEAVRCVGCCGLSPVLMMDQEVYGKVKKDQLAEILAKYREK
ncbi:MAG TPA: NAD(P)H-dependent oxidoreductase subunit E [Spirochaetales bacterium]|nr:NAD(P)H-dependent oxidoreductase subunit E [Spirochaetales bacterium]HOV37170.1 NAD(P)H-dependent oxidoreductase subunit E [Spirochaetales bacterium]